MPNRDKLEPLEDGFVAFRTESGERWKHKDVAESRTAEPGDYRLFISDKGERRRYVFKPKEPRDATVWDLRMQLSKSEPMTEGAQAGR